MITLLVKLHRVLRSDPLPLLFVGTSRKSVKLEPSSFLRPVRYAMDLKAPSSASPQLSLLEQLLQSCAPATFGRENKDVLDESYRKAGKLDRSQFSVDFHPHDFGIIDTINQILLPQVSPGFMKGREQHRGVMAELYKLNVFDFFSL